MVNLRSQNAIVVIFVEQPDKTLLDWCENKWIKYLNAKININKIFLYQLILIEISFQEIAILAW